MTVHDSEITADLINSWATFQWPFWDARNFERWNEGESGFDSGGKLALLVSYCGIVFIFAGQEKVM
jgi:hypothetical protein